MTGARRRGNGEGGITLRKDGRYQGSYYVETSRGRKRQYVYGTTRKEVSDELFAKRQLYSEGLLYDAELLTVSEYLTSWLESVSGSVKEKTWTSYEGTVRLHVVPELGGVKLSKLTPLHVQNLYAKKLQKGLSATSVNNIHRVLRRALNCAVRWNLLANNVCKRVDAPQP